MNKRTKKKTRTEEHIIDMHARLHIKIVKTTIEEEEEFQKDLCDMQKEIEKSMKEYEEDLKRLIRRSMNSDVINATSEDVDRYVELYRTEYSTMRKENIERRAKQLLGLIEEQK